jgi:hypothetical protein
VDQPFEHAGDYYFVPMVAVLGTNPPDDIAPHLTAFQGERLLKRTIEPGREATAWLSEDLMIGAEADNVNTTRSSQFHPVTVHWRTLNESIGWMRTRCETVIQASAKPRELHLSGKGPAVYVFELNVENADTSMIRPSRWTLPGLTVELCAHDVQVSVRQNQNILTVRFAASGPVKMLFSV